MLEARMVSSSLIGASAARCASASGRNFGSGAQT
jgi:hypothetical protein